MTHRILRTIHTERLERCRAAIALTILATALACGPRTSAPTPAAAPSAAPPPSAVMQTCPDPTDGASIIVNAVDEANHAFVANPSTPLPPACVLTAFARITNPLPDSVNEHALALAAELRRRGTSQREVLAAEIVVLARMRRYADVSKSYDRLVTLDSQPPVEVSKLAISAARQRADTASLVRILARTASQPGAGAAVASELNVLRQVKALWAAINESRGLVRQNPKYVAAYPSLVGNFGTLDMPDSVAAFVRRALAQGAPAATLSPALETLVTAMLRHAALYGNTYGWDAPIAAASRVDSALTTPSTKFLVAALIVHSVEPRIAELTALVSGTSVTTRSPDVAARERGAACQRVAPLSRSLNAAQARLRAGGDRYTGGGVPQLNDALSGAQARVAGLQEACARAG